MKNSRYSVYSRRNEAMRNKKRLCDKRDWQNCSPMHSTSLEMSEVLSGTAILLISEPKQTDQAILIWQMVLHINKHEHPRLQILPLLVYTSYMHNKTSLESSVFPSDYIVVGDY